MKRMEPKDLAAPTTSSMLAQGLQQSVSQDAGMAAGGRGNR